MSLKIAKMTVLSLLALALAVNSAFAANANETIFKPTPQDLYDLDHGYAYTWGIAFTIPQGHIITSAVLEIFNIDDWTVELNDHLFIRLLENAPIGVKTYTDKQAIGDYFTGMGHLIADYQDPGAGKENLIYDFNELGLLDELNACTADGNFGLSFDPDCHYYNDMMQMRVKTAIPEPASFVWLSGGLLSILGIKLKNRK